jgi:hypothetical protein
VFVSQVYLHPRACDGTFNVICLVASKLALSIRRRISVSSGNRVNQFCINYASWGLKTKKFVKGSLLPQ